LIILIFFMIVDLQPDLSHLDITIYSGSQKGNYYAIAKRTAMTAERKNGKIKNIETRGSMENVEKLEKGKDKGVVQFAIIQDGMPPSKTGELELIARITSSETVFFLGPNADSINNISDLRGMHIGIGPEGSGTAHLAGQIFSSPGLEKLSVKLSNHPIAEQIGMLRKGMLDLAIIVIAENASIIEDAVRKHNMQIASFRQCESLAKRLLYLRTGTINAGYYDPLLNLPKRDKKVLRVDTLVVGNGTAGRSDTVGILTILNELYPRLINYNRNTPNMTGMAVSEDARRFMNNRGPEVLDRYAPKLANYIPLGTLVQFAMIISILFNIMGGGNRFCLWRIDAARIRIENRMKGFFGQDIVFDEISKLQPLKKHNYETAVPDLQGIIDEFEALLARCRKQSQSMLVPMGKEMGYRYQEEIIGSRLVALRSYFRKLNG
ncbi:MAG: hypothetical protein KJ607_13370, partial [Bacteroidetes bacterium]|nr:hypothetical protein [Bacteroidota bacterium]